MEWIKTIDKTGHVKNINWSKKYDTLRQFLNASFPSGYVWHEAVVWNSRMRSTYKLLTITDIQKWIFLPRKHSTAVPYDPLSDEMLGTNLMVIASDDWRDESDLELRRVGLLEPEWGYTSLKVIPGRRSCIHLMTSDSNDLVALKVRERDGATSTQVHIFDENGQMLMEPVFLEDGAKYEGVEILTHE